MNIIVLEKLGLDRQALIDSARRLVPCVHAISVILDMRANDKQSFQQTAFFNYC